MPGCDSAHTFLIFIAMDTDFHKLYSAYSTVDLLKITTRPEKYQPAAVAAAQEILATRVVTTAERDEAEKFYSDTGTTPLTERQIANNIGSIFSGPNKWVNIILTIAILEYLHLLYIDLMAMSRTLLCRNCPFQAVSILSYTDLLYLPVVFYLFYKRKQWGWILLFASKLFPVIPYMHYYFSYQLVVSGVGTFPGFLFRLSLNLIVVGLMWRADVASNYKVTNTLKWLTVAGVAVLLLLVWLPSWISQL